MDNPPTAADISIGNNSYDPVSSDRGLSTYVRFAVINNGTTTIATDVSATFQDTTNPLSFISADNGLACQQNGNQTVCQIGDLQPGQQFTVALDLAIATQASCTTSSTITPLLSASSSITDPDSDNNTASPSFTATCPTAACGNGTVETGEECNEPGLSCGTDQTCNTNTCACEVSPPQSSASSAGNQSNCGNGVLEPPDEECDFMDPDIPQGECDETCHLITPVPDF